MGRVSPTQTTPSISWAPHPSRVARCYAIVRMNVKVFWPCAVFTLPVNEVPPGAVGNSTRKAHEPEGPTTVVPPP